MKVLVLRIFSPGLLYDEMRRAHQRYSNDVYVEFDSNLPAGGGCQYDHATNSLWVPGSETLVPGILNKTMEAIEFCLRTSDFDVLIRSNASTVLNTLEICKHVRLDDNMCAGPIWKVGKGGDAEGTVGPVIRGQRFIMGSCIVLPRKVCQMLVQNRNKINQSLVDDVAIGLFLDDMQYEFVDLSIYWAAESAARSCPDALLREYCVFRNRQTYQPDGDRTSDVARIHQQYNIIGADNLGTNVLPVATQPRRFTGSSLLIAIFVGYQANVITPTKDDELQKPFESKTVGLAEYLVKSGHRVHIFGTNFENHTRSNKRTGVYYHNDSFMHMFMQQQSVDVLIIQRYIHVAVTHRLCAKKVIMWIQDNCINYWYNQERLPGDGYPLLLNVYNLFSRVVYETTEQHNRITQQMPLQKQTQKRSVIIDASLCDWCQTWKDLIHTIVWT